MKDSSPRNSFYMLLKEKILVKKISTDFLPVMLDVKIMPCRVIKSTSEAFRSKDNKW